MHTRYAATALQHGTSADESALDVTTPIAPDSPATGDLLVLASRLPVAPRQDPGEGPTWAAAPGGVATALSAALRTEPSTWIGWSGSAGPVPDGMPTRHGASEIRNVELSEEEITHFYERFCNAALWPVLHGWAPTSQVDAVDWDAYRAVNERFALIAANAAARDATVWVHDYQLMLVPGILRMLRPDLKIGFFLHTSMPQGRVFARVPGSDELINGMLGADLLGFQTKRDVFRFAAHAGVLHPVTVGRQPTVEFGGRTVTCASHPISVDIKRLATAALHPRIQARAQEIRASLGRGRTMVLGVDRLDYTKGIPTRLNAFAQLVEEGTVKADEIVFVQVAAPSRVGVAGYAEERRAVERAVADAMDAGAAAARPPVVYRLESLSHEELLAHYVAADVLCVTPFKDGMNLIAKEFVAVCRPDAALVLSAEAGAADELASAWVVDPYDVTDVKRGLFEALRADSTERQSRVAVMRHRLWQHDVHDWAAGFLAMLRGGNV